MSARTDITVMFNFYDEPLENIARSVGAFRLLGVTHVVAADGAYANFPDGEPLSNVDCRDQLIGACACLNLPLTLHTPSHTWEGDEVAKRQFMLDVALAVTPPGGWLMVWDGDYELLKCDIDVQQYLSDYELDALDITFTTAPEEPAGDHWFRMFMRATPGIRMGGNHYTYVYPDGSESWVTAGGSTIEGHWERRIRVYHGHFDRDEERHARQAAYYEVRDRDKLEAPPRSV